MHARRTLPPLEIPPPPGGGGDRHLTVLLGNIYCSGLCSPCVTCTFLHSHSFKSVMFSPGDHVWYHSRTLGAHVLATLVGPSPDGPQFCHIRYCAQLSRLEAVEEASPKSPESPDITPCLRNPKRRHSPHSLLHLCSVCLHQWRVPQFALEYPCNPPPPQGGDRHLMTVPPPPPGGDRRALWGGFQVGGIHS